MIFQDCKLYTDIGVLTQMYNHTVCECQHSLWNNECVVCDRLYCYCILHNDRESCVKDECIEQCSARRRRYNIMIRFGGIQSSVRSSRRQREDDKDNWTIQRDLTTCCLPVLRRGASLTRSFVGLHNEVPDNCHRRAYTARSS